MAEQIMPGEIGLELQILSKRVDTVAKELARGGRPKDSFRMITLAMRHLARRASKSQLYYNACQKMIKAADDAKAKA